MRLRFQDNYGTRETVYFNPQVNLYDDGSIIINDSYAYLKGRRFEMPLFGGDSEIVWADIKGQVYSNSEVNNKPGSFKVMWRNGNTVTIVRYKDVIDESFWKKWMRKISEIFS